MTRSQKSWGQMGDNAEPTKMRLSLKDFGLYTRDLVNYPQADTEMGGIGHKPEGLFSELHLKLQ